MGQMLLVILFKSVCAFSAHWYVCVSHANSTSEHLTKYNFCLNSLTIFIVFQPLYGLIEAKLELITHAYFKERDFSEVSLLEDTYTNLNLSLSDALVSGSQVFLGNHLWHLLALKFISLL